MHVYITFTISEMYFSRLYFSHGFIHNSHKVAYPSSSNQLRAIFQKKKGACNKVLIKFAQRVARFIIGIVTHGFILSIIMYQILDAYHARIKVE